MNKPTLSRAAKSALKATEELLAYYKRGYKQGGLGGCPFCCRCHCRQCPWVVLDDGDCINDTRRYFLSINELRERAPIYWRRSSIKRLTRWARLIRNGTYDRKLKGAK